MGVTDRAGVVLDLRIWTPMRGLPASPAPPS